MDISFEKLLNLCPHIDINKKSKNNKINFNKNSYFSYVFETNGFGKTSICQNLHDIQSELFKNEKIELFSYENDFIYGGENILINKNIAKIERLKREIYESYNKDLSIIIESLRYYGVFNSLDFIKKFIIENDIYFEKICYTKGIKKPKEFSKFMEYFISDPKDLKKYSSLVKSDIKDIELNDAFINTKFDKNIQKLINNLINLLNKIKDDSQKTFESFINLSHPTSNLKSIRKILDFLNDNNWNNDKCPICECKINLEEIKNKNKKIYNEKLNSILNDNDIKNIYGINQKLILNECVFLQPIIQNINNIINSNSIENLILNSVKSIEECNKFLINFEQHILNIKILILKQYYIAKNDFIVPNLDFLNKEKDLQKLINERTVFDDKSCNFIKKILEEIVGQDRLNLGLKDGNIYIDKMKYDDAPLSTGEKNLIKITSSLLMYANNSDSNRILLIDDPISSYDGNNKLNILYLINYFANEYKDLFKTIIFTHNIETILIPHNAGLTDHQPKIYILKNIKNSFKSDNITGFIEISFSEINFISLPNIREFIKLNLSKNEINDKLIESNINCFIVMIPIIRAFSNLNGGNKYNDTINKIVHYNKDFIMFKEDVNLINSIKFFYNFENFDTTKLIVSKFIDFLKDFYSNDKYSIQEFSLFKDLDGNLSKIINDSLHRLMNMFMIRILLEKKLYQLNKKDLDSLNIDTLRKLINNSKLDDTDKSILKNNRILFNQYIHLENSINLILPSMEFSCVDESKQLKSILNIFNLENLYE